LGQDWTAAGNVGNGAALRPSTERRWQSGSQRLLVADQQIVTSVRTRAFAMSIGPGRNLERAAWIESTERDLTTAGPNFALHLKQAGFDRAGATESPQ
jgi:hypothetical protein